MNVRRFFGKNSREALQEVRRALGPDAAVLSNRSVDGGIEITAIAADEIPPAAPQRPEPARPALAEPRHAAPLAPDMPLHSPGAEAMVRTLLNEIASMRSAIEQQLDGMAWGEAQRRDPARMSLLRQMLQAGFSPALARKVMDRLPPALGPTESRDWVQGAIARNLPVVAADDMVAQGGVYALMGPTGVGKTTTTAKLAARCVVRHGADSLALLTTDTYRIGGQEQLRIYGRILGVPVHAVHDEADLQRTLGELGNKHMVLIDTVGVSQRDQKVADQVSMLCGTEARRLLLLNATCSGPTLDDVIRAYQGKDLHGCILTKLDEAVNIGPVLDSVIRHRIPLHYVATGQRVPEDLHAANQDYLVHRAFKGAGESAVHELNENEFSMMMSRPLQPAPANLIRGGALA